MGDLHAPRSGTPSAGGFPSRGGANRGADALALAVLEKKRLSEAEVLAICEVSEGDSGN